MSKQSLCLVCDVFVGSHHSSATAVNEWTQEHCRKYWELYLPDEIYYPKKLPLIAGSELLDLDIDDLNAECYSHEHLDAITRMIKTLHGRVHPGSHLTVREYVLTDLIRMESDYKGVSDHQRRTFERESNEAALDSEVKGHK